MNALTISSFRTEGTGGGCTALVRHLPSGHTLVITDGNLGTDLGALAEYGVECVAALFAPGAWDDSGQDPVAEAFAGTAAEVLALAESLVIRAGLSL